MLVLSRYIGEKFYIQPIVGETAIVQVMDLMVKNRLLTVRLCIQWDVIKKIDKTRRKSNTYSNVLFNSHLKERK